MPDEEKTAEQLAAIEKEFNEGVSLIQTDPEQAVQLLGKVLETRNQIHGDLAEECAEAYLWYARALLEQARCSTDALTTNKTRPSAASKKPEPSAAATESDEPEAKEPSAEPQATSAPDSTADETIPAPAVAPATVDPAANSDAAAPEDKPEPAAGQADTSADQEGKVDNAADGESQSENSGPSEGESESSEEGEGDEEGGAGEGEEGQGESEDLTLAYEMLEYARVICSKSTNPKLGPVYASVHLSLGDVAAERDEFDTALAEYARCQALLEEADKKDLRALAGVHFSTTLALTMVDNLPEARTHCKKAIAFLQQSRNEILVEMDTPVEGEAEAAVDAQLDKLEKQLDEIDSLLKELKDRLEDIDLAIKEQAEFKGVLTEAMKSLVAATHGGGGGVSAEDSAGSGAGTSAAACAEPTPLAQAASISAGAPQGAGGATVVQNLGVAGRGVRRITLQPISQPNQASSALPGPTVGSKRGLEAASGPQLGSDSAAKKPAVDSAAVAAVPEASVENQPTAT